MDLKKTLAGLGMLFTAATANADSVCVDQSFIDTKVLAKTLVASKPETWNAQFLQGLNAESKTKLGEGLSKILASQTSGALAALTRIDSNKKAEKPLIDIDKMYKKQLPEDIRKILSDYQEDAAADKFATTTKIQSHAVEMQNALLTALTPASGAAAPAVLCPIQ